MSRIQSFVNDPVEFFDYSYKNMHSIPRDELDTLQLAALQYRFSALYESVPMVKVMADKQRIEGFESVEDVIPLLFEHTMFKSYPPSLLENNRFDQLTRWLNKLTAHDLSTLDASECECIKDWVQLLDEKSLLKISSSSGTSGVFSFNPISKNEFAQYGKSVAISFFQDNDNPATGSTSLITNVHVVSPTHRYGTSGFVRNLDFLEQFIAGSKERMHTLYPGWLDPDILYLAGRIRLAKAQGTLARLKVNPKLLERQKQFEQEQADMAKNLESFFQNIVDKLSGERILLIATWNMIYEMALSGLKQNLRQVFSPQSVIISGGGAKGLVQPDGWAEKVCEFTGVDRLKGVYGMSEICATHIRCEHNHYHLAPWVIPFVLNPDTSKPLPRCGVTTGRAAFYDLAANTRWGGVISGDEITLHWDGGCSCGKSSMYMEDNIERYSEKRGGDDKITCAATPEAHREAMDFLTSSSGRVN